ncbi:MAG: hypothetical protein ACTS2F_10295 [Thainema sp.]
MSNTLDNLDIIRSFLTNQETLLANAELRVTSTLYARQLLDSRGRTVATMAHTNALNTDSASVVSVRRESEFWLTLNQALQDEGFVPQEEVQQSEFMTFKQLTIPDGYQLRLTEARFMWRTWWTQQRGQRRNLGLQMQLLIRTRENWYPVQDVACNQGTLFIKTLVGEMALQGSDQVVWLERKGNIPVKPHTIQQIAQPAPTATSHRSQSPITQQPTSNPHTSHTQIRATSASDTPMSELSQISRSGMPSASHYPIPNSASSASQNRDRTSFSASSSEPTLANLSNIPIEWQSVVRQTGGKLYIRTEKGYIVVKGEQLSIALQPHQSAQPPASTSSPGSSNSSSPSIHSSVSATSTYTAGTPSSIMSSRRRFFR